MKAPFSRFAKAAGTAVTLISFAYLFYSAYIYGNQILAVITPRVVIFFLIPSGIVYGLFYSIILIVWHHMVKKIDSSAILSVSYHVYARTQIAKYLPGNVFHYLGRQIMMKEKAGIAHMTTLTATAYETVLMAGTSVLLAFMGGFFLQITRSLEQEIVVATIAVIPLMGGAVFLFRRTNLFSKILPGISAFSLKDWASFIALPVVGYLIFYSFMGQLMLTCSAFLFDLESTVERFELFTAVFSAAWLIGFVTPGSPGGMGVREVVLVTGLTPILGNPSSLAIALLMRGITVIGDCVLYLNSFWVGIRKKNCQA